MAKKEYKDLSNYPETVISIKNALGLIDPVPGYTKVQIDAMRSDNFIDGLIAAGFNIKSLPHGVTLNTMLSGTYTLINGDWQYTLFRIYKDIITSGVGVIISTPQASFTENNYNGFSLHSVNPTTGRFTKITETINDGSLFKGNAYSKAEKNWPTSQTLTSGIYAVGLIWSASVVTTPPKINIHGTTGSRVDMLHPVSLKLSGKIASQTSVPSPASPAAITFDTNVLGIYLI